MARYIAIIEYDAKTKRYGAYFPDAPGCTAMSATEDEVIADATNALEEWALDVAADGGEVPEPRTYVQLLKSREFPELGKRGMIASIPLIREFGRVIRANISMDAGVLSGIDEEASRLGITRSAFLASAARDKIKARA